MVVSDQWLVGAVHEPPFLVAEPLKMSRINTGIFCVFDDFGLDIRYKKGYI
jgi:hypothetical protein